MAYEALFRLQQTVKHILINDHKNPIFLPHNDQILSIHDHVNVLQSLLEKFPEEANTCEEAIKEVADKIEEFIKSLSSQGNPSDCRSSEPTDRSSNKLRSLAEELESTAADVVDYVKSNDLVKGVRRVSDSPAFGSSSRPAATSEDDFTSSTLPAHTSNGLVVDSDEDLSDSSVGVVDGSEEDLSNFPAVSTSLTSKDVVVGFDDDLTELRHRLLTGSSNRQVLPIVGVGGIGKTTLAKIVYNIPSVVEKFVFRAWVTLSQEYSVESILLNLLAAIGIEGERDVPGPEVIKSLICKNLINRRYLIVIDDICTKKAWDDVKMVFPDNKRSSRIILTTRQRDVAAYADPLSPIHMVRFLDEFQSWNLLQRKVFADQVCPRELIAVGKKIVKNCRGLPLLIVVVAGLLSRIPKTRKLWNQIAENDGKLETVISLSYTRLPDHLKACFLYLGGFPEDYEIRVSEIIKLWIAEGFIRCEVEAEECMEDLVERSLVLATSKKSDGRIKSCSLHDIVREFCIRQGQVEKILLPVMDYMPTPILRKHFLPQVLPYYQRICATRYDLDHMDSVHNSHIHTVICIPQKGCKSVGCVQKFSSLKVLHVLRGNGDLDWEPGQVFDLRGLTYLASNIPPSIVPQTISKLQNLQSLIFYSSKVRLPVQIWSLRQLRHLISSSFHPLPHPQRKALPLENLQTLSLATNFVCSKRIVEMIPNVKKLGICYSKVNINSGYHLYNLAHLCQLENLKLVKCGRFTLQRILELEKRNWEGRGYHPFPNALKKQGTLTLLNSRFRVKLEILTLKTHGYLTFGPRLNVVFPPSLKKLTLSGLGVPWTDMSIIGRLPNLQVLKLRNYACSGKSWKTMEGEFCELKLLVIDKSHLHHWTTESCHFPRLECLMLKNCPFLYKIPISFGYISTFKLIEVDDSSPLDIVNNIKEIREKQMSSGNNGFQMKHVLHVLYGFVQLNSSQTIQEAAEEFLEDLIKRNLVLVTKRKSNGSIKLENDLHQDDDDDLVFKEEEINQHHLATLQTQIKEV